MRSDEVEGDQIPNPFVELGGTSEVGEQERQTGDLQARVDIDRVGAVEIAKNLVCQQSLCAQERLAPAQELTEPVRRYPQPRQYARVGPIFERPRHRPRAQLDRLRRRTSLTVQRRDALELA